MSDVKKTMIIVLGLMIITLIGCKSNALKPDVIEPVPMATGMWEFTFRGAGFVDVVVLDILGEPGFGSTSVRVISWNGKEAVKRNLDVQRLDRERHYPEKIEMEITFAVESVAYRYVVKGTHKITTCEGSGTRYTAGNTPSVTFTARKL